ncbi:hypothetical protein WH96_04020 [Kiloniella spongiae]|uniref:Uncharacterized protein n=1 Tax=Kiloniella spongiae TaxID=1489064 RepID=A0A0H2MLD9_9PROT|nr:hypothetical protein [Kiloniella spongiae]KLN61547.1 hypothetical protein WH96_04020 [Kiloniella spongiae]
MDNLMAASLPSLQRFARLNSNSDKTEVSEVVAAVIEDLRVTVKNTIDPASARRSIADLLDFLNSLKSTVHPGRVELAQSISQKIIPELYQKDEPAEYDNYEYLRAEYLLVNHICSKIADNLSLIRGEVSAHPGFRKGRREFAVHPLCIYATIYASGIRDLMTKLVTVRLRNKKIQTTIYEPLTRDVIGVGKNPDSFFEDNVIYIDEQVTKLLDWGISVEQAIAAKKSGTPDAPDEFTPKEFIPKEFTGEELLIQELRDKLKLHSEINEYFLPQSAGFELIRQLYTLNKGRFLHSVKEIQNATKYGNDHSQVVLQIDQIVNDTAELEFDLIALSAHAVGGEQSMLTYKALQDICIGSARTRDAMLEARPLIAAELGRQPIHMAKQIIFEAQKKIGNIQKIEEMFENFREMISRLNQKRFEPEIKTCASMMLASKSLHPLVKWLENEGAEEGTFFLRMQQVQIVLKKKWNIV